MLGFYSKKFATSLGCTHHCLMHGLLPAYFNPNDPEVPVVFKHEVLAYLDEYLICPMWQLASMVASFDDGFMIRVGRQITKTN